MVAGGRRGVGVATKGQHGGGTLGLMEAFRVLAVSVSVS